MRLKTFAAATMSEAMQQVRETLGEDAIIVATREEEDRGVRVTAAIEEDSAPAGEAASPANEAGDGGWGEERDVAEEIADALHGHGVPAALSERILDTVSGFDTPDPVLALAGAFDALFTFNPLPDRRTRRALFVLGPPGAGKTVVTAKLAARAHLAGARLGVISTDTVRAGGVDQLRAFTRIMETELATASDPDGLASALARQRDSDFTVIDGPGLNHFVAEDMAELEALVSAAPVEPVLVMPAGGDGAEAAEVCQRFAELGARRLFVTRLDMVRRLGSILTMADESGLQFSDVSASPQVGEGLTSLNPKKLARLFLPEAELKSQRLDRTGTHA